MVRIKTIFFSHFEKGPILLKNLQNPPKRGVTLDFSKKMILTLDAMGQIFQKPLFDPRADAYKFRFILVFSAYLDPCHKHIFQKICYQNKFYDIFIKIFIKYFENKKF
jgi:hypothetical protein